MPKKIPAVIMRGGTSKGVFFHSAHLPQNKAQRDQAILKVFGSPDSYGRQMNGLGGGMPQNSKTAVISPSKDPKYDVVYDFGQVSIDRPIVDTKSNCGNMSSAVGPFAVDQGLVPAVEPVTTVRIHQKNTDKLIIAEVPVQNGRYDDQGDYEISGIEGTGSKVTLRFNDPGGAVTGELFPTGNLTDNFIIEGIGQINVTMIDAANPVVLVAAKEIGLTGVEMDEFDTDDKIKTIIESIRCKAAVAMGITRTEEDATLTCQTIPKLAVIAPAQTYEARSGKTIQPESIHLVVRMVAMGSLHSALAVSVAIASSGASMIEGTIAFPMKNKIESPEGTIFLGHPAGIIDVEPVIDQTNGSPDYVEAGVGRTARCLMDGHVYIPE